MNNRNLEERIFMGKFAIIFFRILYIFLIIISIVGLMEKSYTEGIGFGSLAVILILINILMKYYNEKLENLLKQHDSEYEKKKIEIMNKRQEMANEVNKNTQFEVDESKIVFSENDKKRIKKNCEIMRKKNLPFMKEMNLIPFDAVVKIKTKEEIAKQMISEFIIAHKAVNRINKIGDIDDQEFITFILKYPDPNVYKILSQISNGEVDEFYLNELSYLHEQVNVYMWILGLGDKPLANKECFIPLITYNMYKYKDIEDLIDNCKMKSYEEIMEYADLITRYEWAMIELDKNGVNSKKINKDSILEQKSAIDWVTSFDSTFLLKDKEHRNT